MAPHSLALTDGSSVVHHRDAAADEVDWSIAVCAIHIGKLVVTNNV